MSSAPVAGISTTSRITTMAAPTTKKNNATTAEGKAAAAAAKMHRRSRSGCFTCRLRRKKCSEERDVCRACNALGLRCDYKRPHWWSNSHTRAAQKEIIKNVIKQTQVSKKAPPHQQHSATTPPSLCHSIPSAPTSADVFSSSMPHSRAPSVDSPFSDFAHITTDGYFQMPPPPQHLMSHSQYPMFSPYEVDIKTERSVFVNDVQTRKDSTISTFSTFQPPPQSNGLPVWPADSWVQQEYHENFQETFPEEPVDFEFFDFPHGQMTPTHETIVEVEECDKYLLSHFLDKVIKLIFPILDANQHGSTRSDVVLPALESNKAYLHCCLSIAATHMKATEGLNSEQIDNDIVRHRYSAISELCAAYGQDTNHSQILEATLATVFFQCSVGRPDDAPLEIPWHQHFDQAATNLIFQLDLPQTAVELSASGVSHPSFNMTLASWIDILGATMLNRAPKFADTYRELNLNRGSVGLAELMGCDDHVMFLISEIACLDLRRSEGLDDVMLCKYVEIMAAEIGQTEGVGGPVASCFSTTGAIRPKQLRTNITAMFRVAARIYLCTLVPGYEPSSTCVRHLVAQFSELMNFIPEGTEGFDRSLAWPLLIAGASATADSPFRAMFSARSATLGDAAEFGSFGRISELLNDLWIMHDTAAASGDPTRVHWRDIMRQKQWDILLI